MILQTKRLLLRPPRPNDLVAPYQVYSNSDAMQYWNHAAHVSISKTERTLERMIASSSETGLEFVIEHDGAVIGKAGLWRIAELGYILRPDVWGKGIAREALSAIIDATWARYPDQPEITAEIDPRNMASARLLTYFGFQLTHSARATIRINGEWCDSEYYALPRPEPGGSQTPAVF